MIGWANRSSLEAPLTLTLDAIEGAHQERSSGFRASGIYYSFLAHQLYHLRRLIEPSESQFPSSIKCNNDSAYYRRLSVGIKRDNHIQHLAQPMVKYPIKITIITIPTCQDLSCHIAFSGQIEEHIVPDHPLWVPWILAPRTQPEHCAAAITSSASAFLPRIDPISSRPQPPFIWR